MFGNLKQHFSNGWTSVFCSDRQEDFFRVKDALSAGHIDFKTGNDSLRLSQNISGRSGAPSLSRGGGAPETYEILVRKNDFGSARDCLDKAING